MPRSRLILDAELSRHEQRRDYLQPLVTAHRVAAVASGLMWRFYRSRTRPYSQRVIPNIALALRI